MVFAKVPIRYFSKTCKSFIKTWFRRTKSSSLMDGNMRRRNHIHQEPVVDDKAGKNMKGIKKSRLNGDTSSDDDPMPCSRIGCFLCRHRSEDNSRSYSTIASSSRNKTTNNIKRKNHARSKSMENFVNCMPTPTSSNSAGNSTTPHDMRSRSLSKKKMLSRNGSSCRKSIMYSSSSGILKPPPIEKNIECTLEELCYGCTKKIMITRDILTDKGDVIQVEELLTINVQPGWKKGTKIKFEGKGNERHNAYSEDIIFYVSEKRHELFRREGDDLELSVEIPLLKALIGCTVSIPLLGGEHMNLKIDDIIHPGHQKIITDQGMPMTSASEKRGNLRVKFLVEFPTHLTDNQKSDVFGILQNSC